MDMYGVISQAIKYVLELVRIHLNTLLILGPSYTIQIRISHTASSTHITTSTSTSTSNYHTAKQVPQGDAF